MPQMDGPMFVAELKILLEQANLPMPYICCCTAYVEASFKRRAFEAGMNNFLTKPIDYKDLAKMLLILED